MSAKTQTDCSSEKKMVRASIAVIVSYLMMFVLATIAFICAYLMVGAEVAFKPGLYEASTSWIEIAFLINIVVAISAGFICASIAKGGKTPFALAIVVFALGIGLTIPEMMKRKANEGLVRTGHTPKIEAVQRAYWPVWVPFTFPITGAIGVLIGGKLKRRFAEN